MLSLLVPYPPSTNRLWRSVKGRNIKSEHYRDWEKRAARESVVLSNDTGIMLMGPYKLSIDAVRPDKRRRDLGNLEKPLSDLLVSLMIVVDDCLAEEITLRWVREDLGGMVRLTVTPA